MSSINNTEKAAIDCWKLHRSVANGDTETTYTIIRTVMRRLCKLLPRLITTPIISIESSLERSSNSHEDAPQKKVPRATLAALQEDTLSGSRYTQCPACGVSILIFSINEHLDNDCSTSKLTSLKKKSSPSPSTRKRKRSIRDWQISNKNHDSARQKIKGIEDVQVRKNEQKPSSREPALTTQNVAKEYELDEAYKNSFVPVLHQEYFLSLIAFRGALILERERRYLEAVLLLEKISKIPVEITGKLLGYRIRYRFAQDLVHLKKKGQARNFLEECLRRRDVFGFAGAHRKALERLYVRCGGKRGEEEKILREKDKNGSEGKEVSTEEGFPLNMVQRGISNGGPRLSVEQFAIEWYQRNGWEGVHSENGPFVSLFMILFMDVLYDSDDKLASHSDFPLGLRFPHCRSDESKKMCEERLSEISLGHGDRIFSQNWKYYHGTQAFGVNWNREDAEGLMHKILKGFPSKALSAMCNCFCTDFLAHLGGLPDLLLWKVNSKEGEDDEVEIMLVEVKGPGDRLSDRQIVWLRVLYASGVRIEIFRAS
mmetsp:Transcript_17476/g.26195  ORF Transcript_17476/g.26195 Transcript_17476/m.26195 type:complete len:542 (-) Transcript_17476:142-1767(-)